MSYHTANLVDSAGVAGLTIANAGQTSNPIASYLSDATSLTITAPSALTGTVTIQVSVDGTNYVDLGSGGSDVTIGAGNSVTISPVTFSHIRVSSGSAEGATRSFGAMKTFKVG